MKPGVTGSTTSVVCHVSDTSLHVTALGDCQVYVYRQNQTIGAREIYHSIAKRMPGDIPPQTFLAHRSDLTIQHVANAFAQSYWNVLRNLQPGDTIVVVSDGVIDNIGDDSDNDSKHNI